ncbi:MAG: efflux transporter periplasmic adaptor subunit, partial [Alphaproteobacteria bacterium]|nr:efflux transporter periplasmic adaptor subunit [Alphaproteobacteria bacterium]
MARYRLELAKKKLSRTEELLDRGSVSRETYDIEVTERDVAQADVAGAEANFRSSLRGVDAAQAV